MPVKLKKHLREWAGVLLMVPMVTSVIALARIVGWLQPLELAAYDQFVSIKPPQSTDPRILIIEVSEEDIRTHGHPIPDGVLARLIQKLNQSRPAAIGLDIVRDIPVPPGHAELEKTFRATPNLIGIAFRSDTPADNIAPPPALPPQQVGLSNMFHDADGITRRGLLYLSNPDGTVETGFSMKLAALYLQKQGIALPQPENLRTNSMLQIGNGRLVKLWSNDGGYVNVITNDKHYLLLINYRAARGGFSTATLTDVLENRVPENFIRNRVILIGYSAPSVDDTFLTPYRTGTAVNMLGVAVHATMVSQILNTAQQGETSIRSWPEPVKYLWIIVWGIIGTFLSWQLRSPRHLIPALLVLQLGLFGSCYLAFLMHWWIPLIPPTLALLTASILTTLYVASLEHQERQLVMTLFGRHVTPDVAEMIWQNREQVMAEGRMRGKKMTATVLFTDLKDFSSITERTSPESLMDWLNEYMEAMVQLVLEHGGIVDKLIGDAVMAIFGVPIPRTTTAAVAADACHAVQCAIAMARALEQLNQRWQARQQPLAYMRIGIATGEVITGSLGSQKRLDYTTIGDSVNVAARLESYNKSMDTGLCRILIDEVTFHYIQGKFSTQYVGTAQLKGRQQNSKIYQVLVDQPASLSYQTRTDDR
ncbi:hypothetical protein BST81_03020 [Leptolyngbya sp. 'hensonii']|uniref:CHASE2 domain-containing protein n=1 Tax=Leptolyngbya sp. 'hensonii' TaxID=1922337 RepID=UPI0009501D4D|nr:adenylate/guanylate cyclase domain-containing protein [Leptolyngbya sp. 'hensonii']OLP19880.1 hypothetical protein BST81_03020 [Leptolyngbya sp. 'hensonii']